MGPGGWVCGTVSGTHAWHAVRGVVGGDARSGCDVGGAWGGPNALDILEAYHSVHTGGGGLGMGKGWRMGSGSC